MDKVKKRTKTNQKRGKNNNETFSPTARVGFLKSGIRIAIAELSESESRLLNLCISYVSCVMLFFYIVVRLIRLLVNTPLGGFSFSIIWSKNSVFLFDSHSRDENGGFVSNGCSVLLSFRYLNDVQYYIHAVYSKQLPNFPEIQYEIQYIRVATDVNLSAILDSINKMKKTSK